METHLGARHRIGGEWVESGPTRVASIEDLLEYKQTAHTFAGGGHWTW